MRGGTLVASGVNRWEEKGMAERRRSYLRRPATERTSQRFCVLCDLSGITPPTPNPKLSLPLILPL
jgi:hypothetical protein